MEMAKLFTMTSHPDFILFPEGLTSELLASTLIKLPTRLAQYTDRYLDLFHGLAKEKSVYIVAGTHLKKVEGRYYNTSHLFTPDGQVMEQRKVHLLPMERGLLHVSPGESFAVFQTEKARISILICYDLEFPEAAWLVTLQGAEILFSPSATADAHGYWRVRHCAQARCIENQIYVAHSSLLGGLGIPGLQFWGTASILSPCDKGFPDKGIVAEGHFNEEGVVTAEVDTDKLYEIRKKGTTTNLKDRRPDLLEALYKFDRTNQP